MKTSKKLTILGLSAATALVAATGAVSSFAWFAANGTVEANGMTIKALANDAYLQIGNSTESFNDDTKSYQSAAATLPGEGDVPTLTPTHLFKSLNDDKKSGNAYDGGSDRVWVTGHSKTVDNASLDPDSTFQTINTINGTYALINEFQLRLRPAANGPITPVSKLDISVDFANDSTDLDDALKSSVSVLVSTGDDTKGQLFEYGNSGFAATNGTSDTDVVENLGSTIQRVKIYVFFDGENENCKSANVVADHQYSVNVTFKIHPETQNA